MINKFDTCQGCPDRSLSCRASCEGWQAREQDKAERYERRAIHAANYNTYGHRKEMIMKRAKVPLKGW